MHEGMDGFAPFTFIIYEFKSRPYLIDDVRQKKKVCLEFLGRKNRVGRSAKTFFFIYLLYFAKHDFCRKKSNQCRNSS